MDNQKHPSTIIIMDNSFNSDQFKTVNSVKNPSHKHKIDAY